MAKHKVMIRYKSGIEVKVTCDDLQVKWDQTTGNITSLTWENMEPEPIKIGLLEIESIWRV